jgi:photosystem II stability/assembly factor-like uncharacterized protein
MGLARHRWILLAAVALAAAAALLYLLVLRTEDEGEGISLAACLEQAAEGEAGGGESGDPDAALQDGNCALRAHPETYLDLASAHDANALRLGADSTGDYAAATRLRAHAETAPRHVRGAHGRWRPVGKGPLHADDPSYPDTYGTGFAELAGRVSDYSYDSQHNRLYASVASGGVWVSSDKGKHWSSRGNDLPTQTVGSLAYSPAGGGTLIAVTGDNAFGGNTYGGLGVYRSTNGGRTWTRSHGVPGGLQGFKAAVDPTNPNVIYAATGGGLFRSSDAGRTFHNVNLPIGGRCEGTTFRKRGCFFANVVTDVVVEAPDDFGNKGGTVLAAIGWRDGARKNFDGTPEAPRNGLYRSSSGRPGTFQRLDVDSNGFAPQQNIGRVEMGAATGADQNHDYIYALVQDAVLFNKGTVEGLDAPNESAFGVSPTSTPTYFNGVYVSDDFGKTWTQMESRQELLLPTSGSTLAQLTPLGFGPGIQSWYDMWIRPDPTRTLNGVPTRVVFGLEELYENSLPVPQDGHSNFRTIGAYNANGGPCLLVLASDACSDAQNQTQQTTTHPDQHAGIFIPDDNGGGVTAVAGNDGGNYMQHTDATGDLTQAGWGKGDQQGFHTLLPYGVTAARDGVVYAGLQDNGEIRIDPQTGKQNEVFGGDGVFTLTEPKNSDVVYEETPEASIRVSTDGGVTWSDISPLVNNASFYSPIAMDPKNPRHLLSGGRQIVETTHGPQTTSPSFPPANTDWKTVFNLRKSKRKIPNQVSSIDVRGRNVYAGYCGGCDVVRDKKRFFSGIATNVGGKQRPKPGTKRGWHKVKAKGLPQRFISDITIDPRHRKTIYVTLGASDLRPYAPPKAEGRHSGISSRGGHIYRSTNGGRSFHDISGNLKRVPALWSMMHRGQLIVATTVGVFASAGTHGGHYALLGHNLPRAPVFSLSAVPGHRNQLLAASLGRGIYRYTFR